MSNICPCTMGNSISHALNSLRKAKKLNSQQPEQTAAATVLSRRVDTCYQLGWLNDFSKLKATLLMAACVGVFWLQGVIWGWVCKLFTKKEETWL